MRRDQPKWLKVPRGHVALRITPTAAPYVLRRPGWSLFTKHEARQLMQFCRREGRADRGHPWPPGERISLQRLARQIEARLA